MNNNNAKEEACHHTTCIKYFARKGAISAFILFLYVTPNTCIVVWHASHFQCILVDVCYSGLRVTTIVFKSPEMAYISDAYFDFTAILVHSEAIQVNYASI